MTTPITDAERALSQQIDEQGGQLAACRDKLIAAEAELARLRADMEFYRNFAAEVLAVKRLPMPHDMEALCRQAYDTRYHKIKADMSYDNWRLVWVRAIASHEAAPPAQPATRKDCGEAGCAEGRCGNAGCLPSAQPAEPVQRLSDAGIEALAGKHGTTYRNRHFPTQPAFSFSNGSLHRFVRDIESAIQPLPGWRDVESAPKGGCLIDILLPDGKRWAGCHYDAICDQWRNIGPSGHMVTVRADYATHWMPIPPAPKATP